MTMKESTQPDYKTTQITHPYPLPDCALTTPDAHRLTLWWSPAPVRRTEEGARPSRAHKNGPKGVTRDT